MDASARAALKILLDSRIPPFLFCVVSFFWIFLFFLKTFGKINEW